MSFDPKVPNSADEGGRVTWRRLLLAKQLYLHASEHAKKHNGVDKMIAVHNFHNAIEVTLKAILLHHGINTTKSRDPDFETVMTGIDEHFRGDGVQLPYRSDIRGLNNARNQVQHNAYEPEAASMAEWQVITEKFLKRSFVQYFSWEFDQVSQLGLIEDETFRNMLNLAVQSAENGSAKESLVLTAFALEFAINSCIATPSIPAYGLVSGGVSEDNEAYDAIETLNREFFDFIQDVDVLRDVVKDIAGSVDLLARGVSLTDYERFIAITPDIERRNRLIAARHGSYSLMETDDDENLDDTGELDDGDKQASSDEHPSAYLAAFWDGRSANQEDARWAAQFAISAIIQLQGAEPPPHLPTEQTTFAQELIITQGEVASFDEPGGGREVSDLDPRRHRRRFLRRKSTRVAISPEMDEMDEEN